VEMGKMEKNKNPSPMVEGGSIA